jgi:hypothetical protein
VVFWSKMENLKNHRNYRADQKNLKTRSWSYLEPRLTPHTLNAPTFSWDCPFKRSVFVYFHVLYLFLCGNVFWGPKTRKQSLNRVRFFFLKRGQLGIKKIQNFVLISSTMQICFWDKMQQFSEKKLSPKKS